MEQPGFLNEILIFLIAAVGVVSFLLWFRISSIVGYLIAGILIGPYAFAVVEDVEQATLIGQLGVVFLLFTIGLKLPLRRLQQLKRYVFGLGSLQVLATGLVLGALAYFWGQTIEASILIGSGLALSSTAVGIQILSDKGDLAARFGRVTFSVLLFQDLAVVVLLVMLTTLGQEGVHVVHELGYAGLKAICALFIILVAGRLVLRPLYRTVAKIDNSELFIAVTLLVVLMTSVATAIVGLPMELGAFLAGMLLSETEYRHQVESDIQPFRGLLLGLFFMSVGMSIDLQAVWQDAFWIATTLCSLLIVKTILVLIIGRVFALPFMASLRTGLLLAGAGEFVFVLFAMAMEQGLLPFAVGQLLFVVAALSMGLTPLLDRFGKLLEDKYSQKKGDKTARAALEELDDLRNHVIIAGFGRLGRLVGRLLAARMVPFVAIDKDMQKVTEGRAKGMPVFYGDIRRTPMLRALGADRAKTIVVCLSNTNTAVRTALMLRRHFKQAGVCVYLRDDTHEEKLSKAGVSVIMPENLEPSLQLAGSVLSSLGNSEVEVEQAIEAFRRTLTSVVTGSDEQNRENAVQLKK